MYELPEHTALILQLMAPGAMCSHRGFDRYNQTVWGRALQLQGRRGWMNAIGLCYMGEH